MIVCSWSAMAARTSLMQRASDSSLTATCGHAAAASASFEINLLPFSRQVPQDVEAFGPQLDLAAGSLKASPVSGPA